MSKKRCCGNCSSCSPDPTSPNYAEKLKNKANENSPYGKDEPSTHTKHK